MANTLYLVRVSPTSLELVRSLTPNEVSQYQADLDHLREFDASPHYLELVARNQADLQAALSAFRSAAADLRRDVGKRISLQIDVNRHLINYLSSARLLLDHFEMRLKRRYGAASDQVKGFRAATSHSFDTVFGYRFLYKLRNFAQHFGVPATHTHVASRLEPGATPAIAHHSAILLDRDELLRHGQDIWGKVAPEVAALPPVVDAEPYVVDLTAELNRIVIGTQGLERPALEVVGKRVADLLRPATGAGCTPGVALVTDNAAARSTTYEFVQPPFRLMAWLGFPGFERPLL